MAREMTPQERAAALYRALGDGCDLSAPEQEKRDIEAITDALTTARQEALREAAERLGVGDSNGLLAAPCLWCGYNGEGYYQAGTHGQSCPWNTIGGCDERLDRLAREGVR